MSYSRPKSEVLTCKDIIDAYNKHGDEFIVIPPDSKRDWKNYSNYIDVNIKKDNGDIIYLSCLKIDPSTGVTVSTNVRDPTIRQYEQIRFSLRQYDDNGDETLTMKALNILCTSFKNIFKKMVNDNIFTHHKDVPRKKNKDGVLRPVLLISTDPKTPMQNTMVNKLTQEVEEIENPIFWIDIPKKKYRKTEPVPTPEQFGSLCYKENDGSDGKPFMKFELGTKIEMIDSTTKHRVPVGDMDEDGNIILDNTNVHKYLTKDTLLLGAFKFEIKVSSRGAKLNIELFGDTTIQPAIQSHKNQVQTDDDIAIFASLNVNTTKPSENVNEDIIEGDSDEEEFDT